MAAEQRKEILAPAVGDLSRLTAAADLLCFQSVEMGHLVRPLSGALFQGARLSSPQPTLVTAHNPQNELKAMTNNFASSLKELVSIT
jgi:hypothetical protein